jgi:hypothetical protein
MRRVLELMVKYSSNRSTSRSPGQPVESWLIFRLFCPVHRVPIILILFNFNFLVLVTHTLQSQTNPAYNFGDRFKDQHAPYVFIFIHLLIKLLNIRRIRCTAFNAMERGEGLTGTIGVCEPCIFNTIGEIGPASLYVDT